MIYILFIVLLSYVSGNNIKYYTYEKWSLPEGYETSYLKAKPEEIKETLYVDRNDSSLNINGRFNNYDTWKFDNDGNIIFHKFSTLSDSFWIVTKYNFNDEGLQSIIYSNSVSSKQNDTLRIITKKAKTSFLEINSGLDKSKYSIISF